jgi:hypothetical protein
VRTLTHVYPRTVPPSVWVKHELVLDSSTALRLCLTPKGTASISLINEDGEEDSLCVRVKVMDTIEHNHLRWHGCMAGNLDTANAVVSVG